MTDIGQMDLSEEKRSHIKNDNVCRGTGKYYLFYSVTFLLVAAIIYSVFFVENKSLVYALYGDGHICFNSLVYYGSWLRKILTEHCIPMWDMKIGYGSDIFMTLSWETLGDPFNLLAVFFNADNMEYLYDFLAIFRIFLAGLTFSIYSRYHGNRDIPTLAGSIMYAFCGFVLFAGVRDVYFMSPVIYFPLLLLGIDKIFDRKKPYVLIIFTAIAAIANFYYFYMLTVFTVIYALFRFFVKYGKLKKNKIYFQSFFKIFLSCALNYLIGIMIASVQLIPLVSYIGNSERGQQSYYVPRFYSLEFYAKVFSGFISSASNTAWTHLGYAPIMLVSVLVLFIVKKKRYIPYRVAFIMCSLFMCLPVMGSILNGMTYPVNRWIWAFSMLNSYIFVITLDDVFSLDRHSLRLITILSAAYAVICLIPGQLRTRQMKWMDLILAVSVLVIIAVCGYYRKNNISDMRLADRAALVCVLAGVIANGLFRFAPFGSNYAAGFVDAGQAWKLLDENTTADAAKNLKDIETVRCDFMDDVLPMCNIPMNHGINGTDFYFSLADGNVTRYMDDENVNVEMEHRYSGVDDRTMLERLASVRYCITAKDASVFVPYGYERYEISQAGTDQKKDGTLADYDVYENKNSLPLGYSYDSIMKKSDYDKLTAVQKQQTIMQCAVVDDMVYEELSGVMDLGHPTYTDTDTDMSYKTGKGVNVSIASNASNGSIDIDSENAQITLDIDCKADSEIYLVISGLKYGKKDNDDGSRTEVSFVRDGSEKKLVVYSEKHPFNHGRGDYIVNLGYNKESGGRSIKVTFPDKGIFRYDSIKAVCQPMNEVSAQTDRLSADSLDNVNLATNEISGKIHTESDKILCVSVPFSKGWKASVDGEKTDIVKINDLYIGIPIRAGEHDVKLTYSTPGRNAGICVSVIGILLLMMAVVFERRKAAKI